MHSDICGPMSVREQHGATYFITFIDDYTRYGHIFLISHKSEALEFFRRYLSLVENQKNEIVKAFHTEQGGEYLSEMFEQLYNEKEINKQLTIPYTPQQNGSRKTKSYSFRHN